MASIGRQAKMAALKAQLKQLQLEEDLEHETAKRAKRDASVVAVLSGSTTEDQSKRPRISTSITDEAPRRKEAKSNGGLEYDGNYYNEHIPWPVRTYLYTIFPEIEDEVQSNWWRKS